MYVAAAFFASFVHRNLKPATPTGSKDRLHRAKTIDLCQNPLTVSVPALWRDSIILTTSQMQKEPKLTRARQIPEWEEYDTEISQFARKLADRGLIRSGAYTHGADTLANLGATESHKESAGEDANPDAPKDAADQVAADSKKRDEL